MATPPFINCEELADPISGDNVENPAGKPWEYAVRQELDAERKEFEEGPEGRLPRSPDWDKIIKTTVEQLKTTSKDLRLATRLTEALTKRHGLPGLRDGLCLIRTLVEKCWDRLFPVPDEEDGETMAIRGELLSDALSDADAGLLFPHTVRQMPLVLVDDDPYSLMDKQQSDRGKGPIPLENFARAKPIDENLGEDTKQLIEEFQKLKQALGQKLESEAPSLTKLEGVLEECQMFVRHVVPEPQEEAPEEAGGGQGEPASDGQAAPKASAGAIQTREEAYRQLANIANLLEKIEPHSPIPDLLRWAVELGKLPFREMMKQLVEDQGLLKDIFRLLGKKEEVE